MQYMPYAVPHDKNNNKLKSDERIFELALNYSQNIVGTPVLFYEFIPNNLHIYV